MSDEAPAPGICCVRCGCRDLRVVYVRHRPGATVRCRECRHCGRRQVTWERAAVTPHGKQNAPPADSPPEITPV